MELDRISAVVRPRSQWEALDLGIIMARAWWWPLCRAWLAVTLPLFALLNLLLFAYPLVAYLLLWWLKPLWERALLHILSHALFGELPPLRQTLRAFPKLAARQWFASLTYRRFSLSRSMDLPLIQLESLAGRQRSQRLQLLHGKRGTGAGWLTLVGAHIEAILPLALLLLLMILLPNEVEIDWRDLFLSENRELELLSSLLSYGVMTLVAPFYVAAGFSLYLNRRIWLEGWDIELVFRRLLKRVQGSGWASVVGVIVVVIALLLQPDPAMAATEGLDREQARSAIQQIMAGDQFHDRETVSHLDWSRDKEQQDKGVELPEWLLNLIGLLAVNLRAILWAVVIVLVLLFVFKYRHWLAQQSWRLQRKRDDVEPLPKVLFGMEVAAETLPQDVPAEAMGLWRQQHYRAAYALLYRAALSRLMERHGIRFRSGHTEEECRRLVQHDTAPQLGGYFSELTRQWQCIAYKHQIPPDEVTTSLCQRWPALFEGARDDG